MTFDYHHENIKKGLILQIYVTAGYTAVQCYVQRRRVFVSVLYTGSQYDCTVGYSWVHYWSVKMYNKVKWCAVEISERYSEVPSMNSSGFLGISVDFEFSTVANLDFK